MDKVNVKLEQTIQALELYREALAKDGDLNIITNKKIEIKIERTMAKALLIHAFVNNEKVKVLLETYETLLKKESILPITKMKSLDSTVINRSAELELFLSEIASWITQFSALVPIEQEGLKYCLSSLETIQQELRLVLKLVDGNQLNEESQQEFAKGIQNTDQTKDIIDKQSSLLKAIPGEERTFTELEKLKDLRARKETILQFEEDLVNLVDKYKVRIDRKETVTDLNGNELNGQAIFDPITRELVLELDATGGGALGAHELLHLVQAKKGKIVFLETGVPFAALVDLQDEVEAYRLQYAIQPSSVLGYPKKITEITPGFVKEIKEGRIYGELPEEQHDLNTKISKLNEHPQFEGQVKENIFIGEIIDPETGESISAWEYYKDWSFIDFAKDNLFDPLGLKTNAEMVNIYILE